MRVFWRAVLPSAIAVCLPLFQLSVMAADIATVPSENGTWVMTISPELANDATMPGTTLPATVGASPGAAD